MSRLRERRNLLGVTREHWTPPRYVAAKNVRAELRARLLRFLDLQAGTIWEDLAHELPQVSGTVVDVGCGVQPYRQLFGNGVRYIGIDSADTLSTFRTEAPDTVYYSGERWPLESGLADFVLCTETLEHIAEPGAFLSEMYRVLKPGGRAVLTVPFAARRHFIPHDYWRPTPSGLENVLRKAGFTNIGVYGRGNQFTVACYKGMAVAFSLLSPQPSHVALEWLCRLVGALSVPPMLALAVLANASRRWPGTVDFLGFTASAEKPS